MKKIDRFTHNLIKENNRKRDVRHTVSLMSVIVMLMVTVVLIIPAISITKTELDNGNIPSVPSVNTLSSLAKYDLPDSQVSNVSFSQVMAKDEGNIQSVEFTLEYYLNKNDVTVERPYLLYPITSNNIAVTAELPGDGEWGNVMDGATQSGIYHVYTDTNGVSYVLIQFLDDYLEMYANQEITGTVKFVADVVRDDNNNTASQQISIGGEIFEVTGYPERVMDIDKAGTFNGDDGTITWSIKVYNPDAEDMGGAIITDSKITSTSVITSNPANAYTMSGDTVVLNNGITDKVITLTYTETVPQSILASGQGQNIENTVTMNHGGDEYTDSALAYVPAGYSVTKGASTDYSTGEYEWTVIINNAYGNNLNGFKLEDVMINDMISGSLTVTGDGNANRLGATSYSGGVLTFGNISDNQISVTYRTLIDKTAEANQYGQVFAKNTAILKSPSNTELSKTNATAVYMKPIAHKEHQYESSTGLITYTAQFKRNSGDVISAGDYIEDPYLEYATSIVVHKGYYGPLTEGVNYTISGNKVTIIGDSLDQVLTDRENPEIFSIKYTVDPRNPDLPNKTVSGNKTTIINPVEIGDETGPIGTTSDKYEWEPTNAINKQVNGTATTVDNGDGTKTYTIPWLVSLEQEVGGFLGKTLTDTTSITKGSESVTQTDSASTYKNYYNSGSMEIRYTYRSGGNPVEAVLDPSHYTLTDDGNGGFSVYFKDTEESSSTPLANAYLVKLYYTTTAISSTEEALKAKNTANFDTKENSDEYVLEYFNPNDVPYDKTGETSINVKDLEVKTVDSVMYYKIPYVIHMDLTKRDSVPDKKFKMVDTMPAGALLDTDTGIYFKYSEYYKEKINPGSGDYSYYYEYTSGSNVFNIFFKAENDNSKKVFDIEYTILLPKNVTDTQINDDGTKTIANTVIDELQTYIPDSVETTLGNDTSIPNTDNISKTGGQGATDGYVNYSLDVNPSATDLSTGGTIDINDVLSLSNLTSAEALGLYNIGDINRIDTNVDISKVKVVLDKLKIYEIREGQAPRELNSSEYVYEYSGVRTEHSVVDEEYDLTLDSNDERMLKYENKGLQINAANAGDTFDVLITGDTPGAWVSHDSWQIQGTGINSLNGDSTGLGDLVFDSEGKWSATDIPITQSVDLGYVQFGAWYTHGGGKLVSGKIIFHKNVETVKEPSLGLTLPDGKHLRVDYTYKITYETAKDKVGLKLSNSATLDRNGGSDTDDCVNNISIKDSTSATSSTSVPIKLNKLNLNNMNIQVQAGFNIYRYNVDDNVWQVATEIREKDVSVGPNSYHTHIVSSSEPSDTWSGWTNATTQNIIDSAVKITTDDYYISLEKGVIYMLVEIEAPNPFITLNEPKFFTYGNEVTSEVAQAAKSALASVPGSFDLDVSSIDNITNNGEGQAVYDITNRNYINISVDKNWTVPSGFDTSEYKVVVAVYRTGRAGRVNSIPTDHAEVEQLIQNNGWEFIDRKELSDVNNWKYTWYGDPTITDNNAPNKFNGVELVSGSDDETPYYYYVVEESVKRSTDGGNTWTDVTNNFSSSSSARWLIVGTDAALSEGLDHSLGIVDIYNTPGLSIKKIWQNEHRVEMTAAELNSLGINQIEVDLYRSTTAPGDSSATYDEQGVPTDAVKLTATDLSSVNGVTLNGDNIILKKSEGWEVIPEGLPTNDGVNPYYYYVKEVTQIPNSQTVYQNNGQSGGTIFVYNVVNVEDEGGVVLPNTGGKGIKLLRMISLLMILISLITLVYRKRIKEVNNKYISKRRRKGGEL